MWVEERLSRLLALVVAVMLLMFVVPLVSRRSGWDDKDRCLDRPGKIGIDGVDRGGVAKDDN